MGKGGHGPGGCSGHHTGPATRRGGAKQKDAAREEQRKVRAKLIAATVFACIFMSIEVAGGIIAGSLAIVTDAAHLFTDVANFITAILASHLSDRPSTSKHSYGLVRAEVLSALINTGVIVVLAAFLVFEGIRRIIDWFQGRAEPINGLLMMTVAIIGVVFNIALMLIFGHEHGHGGHDHSHGHSQSHGGEHSDSHHHHKATSSGHKPLLQDEDEEGGHGHEGHHHHDGHDEEEHDHDHHVHDHRGVEEGKGGQEKHEQHHQHTHSNGAHQHSVDTAVVTTTRRPSTEKVVLLTQTPSSQGYGSLQSGPEPPREKNINLEAAHLHVITDLVQSIGVAIAGVVVYLKPHWQIVDPICTILFSIVIVYSTLNMLSKTTHVLLEGVPEGVDPEELHDKLRAIEGVTDVHDLHVWMLSVGRPLVTVHMKANNPEQAMREAQAVFAAVGIDHVTVQLQEDKCEPDECSHPCASLACVSTSPNGNTGNKGCTYL